MEYLYEVEPHQDGDPRTHRRIIQHRGHDGWRFVGFFDFWGVYDGKTMLFEKQVEKPRSGPTNIKRIDDQLWAVVGAVMKGSLYQAASEAASLITILVEEAKKRA